MENKVQNNLRELRIKVGLRQKDVAEKLGLKCENRLSHWEQGSAVPSVTNLFKLARLYEVTCEHIYPGL